MDETTKQLQAYLPSHLLRAAYLAGKIPFRACQADPRVSYTLYVPEDAYSAAHEAIQEDRLREHDRLSLVVNIHGTRREAQLCRDSLIKYADQHDCAILAPLFPAALDGPLDLDSYKKLRSRSLKSDEVLLSIIEEVQQLWPAIYAEKFTLLGCSGGGQFVHRFMYLHPERLQRVCVAAPGGTTRVVDMPWPHGTQDLEAIFDGKRMDLEEVRKIEDILIIVGLNDRDMDEQAELKQWLHAMARKGATKVATGDIPTQSRLQTCKDLQQNWLDNGIQASLEIVPGVAHGYQGLLPAIITWLRRGG
ncbi:uncharacterized protein LTR77_007825 [Saxophila tyrrhenica]|uniref:Uncharacterized protein n=1 Tax=Saxophila tyrrhenica TaxID=1690608 RepID=A0AAV9P616_9PEZI|nr:hypothetical protein LTR77_007825 [Saxophila tyrrhenica]